MLLICLALVSGPNVSWADGGKPGDAGEEVRDKEGDTTPGELVEILSVFSAIVAAPVTLARELVDSAPS